MHGQAIARGDVITTEAAHDPSRYVAPDCAGQDFYAIDRGLRDLLALYLPADTRAALEPHFERLGELAGGRLDELARVADQHPPVLHPRDRFGRDEDWIEYHPAYREMEQIAFGDFQFHAMSHRAGVLGLDRAAASGREIRLPVPVRAGRVRPDVPDQRHRHLDPSDAQVRAARSCKDYLLPKMLSADLSTLWKGTQFMTEKAGGSDVGAIETVARERDGGTGGCTARSGSARTPTPTSR